MATKVKKDKTDVKGKLANIWIDTLRSYKAKRLSHVVGEIMGVKTP